MQSARIISKRAILIAAAVGLHLLPLGRDPTNPTPGAAFVISEATPPSAGDTGDNHDELIDPAMRTPSVHAASICELPGGSLAASWYGGTREGHQDVAIYFSIRSADPAGSWSSPRAIVTRESAAMELRRYVRKVGNAVIFADEKCLWLVYVSVAVGGWSGSSLNVKRSYDEGRTWTPSQRLTLSPFCNISELVKNQPVSLTGGGWALPIYHEALGKFSELLWLHESMGRVAASKSRLFGGSTAIQPSLIPLSSHEALALCRPSDGSSSIILSRTKDAGQIWSAPQPAALPNPDSGLDALRLSDGRLLLAFNDSKNHRDNLRLAISNDNGVTWKRITTVVEEPGGEFSYPFLFQSTDNRVHLVYTWQRKGIKHLAFSVAWLNAQNAAVKP